MTASYLWRELAKSVDFLRRDLRIEASYKLSFIFQSVGIFATCCGYYFLARFVGNRVFPDLGVDYFSYILVGVAFFDYLGVSLRSFSGALRDAQMTGTFEQLLVTQTGVGTLVWGGSLYHFLLTTLHVAVYLALGSLVFGAGLARANLAGAAVVTALSILAFSGVGVVSAALMVLFKKGNPLNWLIVSVSWLTGGVLYPTTVLPGWVQSVARWNPLTASLEALRATLLRGAPLENLTAPLGLLLACAVGLLPASLLLFRWAVEQAKVSGTLGDY